MVKYHQPQLLLIDVVVNILRPHTCKINAPSPHRLYDLQDALDQLMRFLPQLSDLSPSKNGFIVSAHTD